MSLQLERRGQEYVISYGGELIHTAFHKVVKSRFLLLMQELIHELQMQAPDPANLLSVYGLMSRYIDLGRTGGPEGWIRVVLRYLREDIVLHPPEDPKAWAFLQRCYANPLFDRLGIQGSLPHPDLDRLRGTLLPLCQTLSCRQIIALSVFSVNLASTLLGLAAITEAITLDRVAQAYCSRLHGYLDCDPGCDRLKPPTRCQIDPDCDDDYCDTICCIYPGDLYPVPLTAECGSLQALRRVLWFSGFPDD